MKQKHSEEAGMIIKYSNEFIQNLVLCDPIKCVNQFIYNQYESNDTNIIQCCIIY